MRWYIFLTILLRRRRHRHRRHRRRRHRRRRHHHRMIFSSLSIKC